MKSRVKKLVLNKETVRVLQGPELRAVVGGGPHAPGLELRADWVHGPAITGGYASCSCPVMEQQQFIG